MNTLSLFSGYGGLDLAVEEVFGAATAYVADIDPGACKILAHRFPDAPNLGDVSTVDYRTLGRVDVITGGFPCQDVSTAGKRAGMKDGTRSGLWSEMHRAVDELRPRYVVIENVRGLLSAAADSDVEPCPWCLGDDPGASMRALGAVLADLADIGYDAAWCGLRAADVGAPHGRFRVFILASPTNAPSDARRVEHGDGATPAYARGEHGQQRRIAAPRQAESGRPLGEPAGRDRAPVALLPTPRGENGNPRNQTIWARPLDQPQNLENALARQVWASTTPRWGKYASAIARWEALTRPAPTATEPTGKGAAHRLSPRFTEWMQGLPDGWITDVPGITRNEALKACGNGVVPQQAAAALDYLLAAEVAS